MVKDVTPTLNDEQQSMQALRQYGGYIISAIVLALAGYFGWQFYQNHGGRVDTAAANDFAKIQNDQTTIANLSASTDEKAAAAQPQLAAANATFNKDLDSFIAQHGDSIYTWQALMLKAKQQMDVNDSKSAVATLQKANTLKIGDTGLQAIATLRLAQALLANNQADEASKTLQASLPPAFDASKEELLGDIAMTKNDKNGAIAHYQKAWQNVEARNQANSVKQDRALLRLKMQELGLNPKQPDLNSGVVNQPTQANQPHQIEQTSQNNNQPASQPTNQSANSPTAQSTEKTTQAAKTPTASTVKTDKPTDKK